MRHIRFAYVGTEPGDDDTGLREVDRRDRAKGLLRVGWHFVVRRDGQVEIGRSLLEPGGFHQQFNRDSAGFCLIVKQDGRISKLQRRAMKTWLESLAAGTPELRVVTHDCPGELQSVKAFLRGRR